MKGLAFIVVAVAGGCTSADFQLGDVSSGQIGCPRRDIQILDYDRGWYTVNWTAVCHGRTYYCSSHGSPAQVTCRRDIEEQDMAADVRAAEGRPDQIDPAQIQAGMGRVRGQVGACTQKAFPVRVSVAPDGSVADVEAGPPIAGTPVATCVERAIATTHFDRAQRGVVFKYTFPAP